MKKETKNKEIAIVDASGITLGRVASKVAMILMGKTKATFKRNAYSGLPVKVINSSKIKISPKKLEGMTHVRHTGYRGGLRTMTWADTIEKKGIEELLRLSVFQMLPDNKIRRQMMKNLTIEK